jgi:hypothetical protein
VTSAPESPAFSPQDVSISIDPSPPSVAQASPYALHVPLDLPDDASPMDVDSDPSPLPLDTNVSVAPVEFTEPQPEVCIMSGTVIYGI